MRAKRALIVYGGWEGHEPYKMARATRHFLMAEGTEAEAVDSLDVFTAADKLRTIDLIVPIWSMGHLSEAQERGLTEAVQNGTGLAGWHGGMADAFRTSLTYQFMVGGQFVVHPGNFVDYEVTVTGLEHPITRGLSSFRLTSEQYYMHVDPANEVLATTTFGGDLLPWIAGTVMPVVWTRKWGQGRVFYSSLGHNLEDFDVPEVWEIIKRGLLWACR